jgi:hypothetical protein
MKSQLAFTHEMLTGWTLYNHCDYYLTLLVINEHLEEQSGLMAMCSYNLHRPQREEDWPPLRAWYLKVST